MNSSISAAKRSKKRKADTALAPGDFTGPQTQSKRQKQKSKAKEAPEIKRDEQSSHTQSKWTQIIGDSLSDVITISQNKMWQEKCCTVLGVSDVKEVPEKIAFYLSKLTITMPETKDRSGGADGPAADLDEDEPDFEE